MKSYQTTALLAMGALSLASCAEAKTEPKNVIMFLTDDQTYHSIRALGNNQVVTPSFDRLVEEGVTFTHHYATTSISMASRACLMTGKYEYKTGCNFMHGAMRNETFAASYPTLMRNAGYYTGFGGKLGFAVTDEEGAKESQKDKYLPADQFDSFAGQGHFIFYKTAGNTNIKQYAKEYPHLTSALAAYGVDFIHEAQQSKKPFCLSLYFKAPHGEYTPDPQYDDVYKDTVWEKAETYGEKYSEHLAKQGKLGRQHLEYFGWYDSDYQASMRKINQLVYGVDVAIGQIMDELKKQGLDKNTIIIFSSDNGYAHGEHNLGGKVLPYEETSKVPLIIFDPSNTKNGGKFTDALAGNIDITATILDYAGVAQPDGMDGRSLRKIVENPERGKVRDYLPLINTWGNPQINSLSVVSEDYKYVYWCCGEGLTPVEELFDCKRDPMELKNIAADPKYSKVMERMRKEYDKRLKVWKAEAVPYNYYQEFATIYDRNIPWSEKRDLISESAWATYDSQLKKIGYEGDKLDYDAVIDYSHKRNEQFRESGKSSRHIYGKF